MIANHSFPSPNVVVVVVVELFYLGVGHTWDILPRGEFTRETNQSKHRY